MSLGCWVFWLCYIDMCVW